MMSEDVWIRRGLKILLAGLVLITAVSIVVQGAIKLTKAAYNARLDPPAQTTDQT
jgi:hypothetical protein